jgi:predicted RNA binding protein YcfA (HicA-like mRNA interferase family)
MRYRELAKRLEKLGCVEDRPGKGSHYFWRNLATGKATSIPDWGKKDLKSGTVRGILRQLGISREEFGPIK